MGDHALHLSINASLDELPKLLDSVDGTLVTLDIDDDSRSIVLLSIDEVFSNIVMHGHLDATKDTIQLRLSCNDGGVCIDICDSAPPFDPVKAAASASATPPDSPLSEMSVGGWGLLIVKAYASDIQYSRENGLNHLKLQFPLPQLPDGAKSSA